MEGFSNHRFGSVSMVTATLGPNDPKVGDRTRSGDEDYLFVYNAGGSTLGASYGATVSAVTGYSVTVSTTTSVDFIVGVCKHADIPSGSYGWIVTKGFAQVEMGANNSAAAGGMIGPGTDGAFGTIVSGIANYGNTVGKAMEAIASGASGAAFICIT
jgi:hypothetical protein